jgi:hypothetical protein
MAQQTTPEQSALIDAMVSAALDDRKILRGIVEAYVLKLTPEEFVGEVEGYCMDDPVDLPALPQYGEEA